MISDLGRTAVRLCETGRVQDFLAAVENTVEGLAAAGRGDAAAAAARLEVAAATFGALGATTLAAQVRLERAGLARCRVATLRRAGDDSVALHPLSPRESQIAALVADGLSNAEIGSRLFISDRTVEVHLRNVYARLGLRSRTALTAWVVRRTAPLAAQPPRHAAAL